MRNPLYILQVTQLVEAFNEVDAAVERAWRGRGSLEYALLEELSQRLALLLPFVDRVALPRSVVRAGKDVGDFLYLFAAAVNAALQQSQAAVLPTVREARKYDQNPFDDSVALDQAALAEVCAYREKARETLRRPAQRYGLSVESSFDSFTLESQPESPQ
ncbi:MAG: hypothetical protein FWF11_01425 [Coriobacteriia bacterium]|nr:hypothetical protein [Coriobacteriia bacterium]